MRTLLLHPYPHFQKIQRPRQMSWFIVMIKGVHITTTGRKIVLRPKMDT